MRFFEWYRRRRAAKGYGVHSPLAFRLVRDAVRPQRDAVYYGEEKLELRAPQGEALESQIMVSRARMVLRVAAMLQPANVWLSPGLPDIFSEALRLAGCVVRIFDGEIFPAELAASDMIVCDRGGLKKKELQAFFRPGCSFIGFDLTPAYMKKVESALNGGVVIDGVGSLIAVRTRDSETHRYEISRF